MIRPTDVEAREGYRIWLRYSDGVEGEIDLSDLVGKGVFAAWNEPDFFEKVHVTEHRAIAWDGDIEICPDTIYMELTGKTLDKIYVEDATPVADA